MANSVDTDGMLHSAEFHLGLHCLLRPVCRNTYGKYGILHILIQVGGIKTIMKVLKEL